MKIIFDDGLKTGIAWQDRQHGELFAAINALTDAVASGCGAEETLKLLDFLDEYVVVHFHDEEKAMGEAGFSGALEHMEEHNLFIEELERIKARLEADKDSCSVAEEINRNLAVWFRDHVSGKDKEMGRFFFSAGKRGG